MDKIFTVLLVACLSLSCKKEYSGHSEDADKISSVDFTYDDENISKSYSPRQPNEFSQYSFGGYAGTYFGYVSAFRISDKEDIEMRFGTLLSQHSVLTKEETLQLLSPGKKIYGSLGAFTSFPQLKPNCAEIAFTDKKSVRWSSTKIAERATSYGIEATVDISQPDNSEFVIDKVEDAVISDTLSGYRVTGHFKCRIYEVNGKHQKELTGRFIGVVSSDN